MDPMVPSPGVLGNDGDPDGDPLTAVLLTPPLQGTLALNADGSLAYTPPLGFSGVVTLTYQAYDGLLASTPATVTLTVAARWQVYLPLVVRGWSK